MSNPVELQICGKLFMYILLLTPKGCLHDLNILITTVTITNSD